jgi:pimeloyl-ACP methyl ester carboxylesterase
MIARGSGGVELYVETSGDAAAPVTIVFAHGWALSMAAWTAVAEALSRSARVVRYDQRGHGRSERLSGPRPTIDQLGDDLAAVLDQLAPSGRVGLVGHSMGGMAILALAARHPDHLDRVTAVALIDTSAGDLRSVTLGLPRVPGWFMRHLMALVMRAWRRWPSFAERQRALVPPRRRIVRRLVRRLLFGPDATETAVMEGADMIQATPAYTVGSFYQALFEHDKLADLERLREVPTLIMVGDQDRLTPPEHSRRMAAALPGAKLVTVPGCGHMLLTERPDIVIEHLEELVGRTDRHPFR